MKNSDQEFNTIFNDYLKDFDQTLISKEQRAILPIIAFTVQGIPEQVESYVQAAVDQRINEEKILEVIYQLEPVVGIGKVQASLKLLTRSFRQITKCNAKMIRNSAKMFRHEFTEREIRKLLADLPDGAGDLSLIT